MASEYKKRGGEYNTDKKDQDDSQKNLSKWSEEDWQTKEGSGNAKQADGTEKRYLPKKAWEDMNEEEKEQTDKKKLEESKEGKQFVGNTEKAKNAREKANKDKSDEYDARKDEEKAQTNDKSDEQENGNQEEGNKNEEKDHGEEEQAPKTGQKRGRGRPPGSNKKQKPNSSNKKKENGTVGSKKDSANPPAKQASADRLPEKGQTVTWKALPGWVEGTVVEIVRENKEVDGKSVKAGEQDPRIVMKSNSSRKIAVHKPEAVYFD